MKKTTALVEFKIFPTFSQRKFLEWLMEEGEVRRQGILKEMRQNYELTGKVEGEKAALKRAMRIVSGRFVSEATARDLCVGAYKEFRETLQGGKTKPMKMIEVSKAGGIFGANSDELCLMMLGLVMKYRHPEKVKRPKSEEECDDLNRSIERVFLKKTYGEVFRIVVEFVTEAEIEIVVDESLENYVMG